MDESFLGDLNRIFDYLGIILGRGTPLEFAKIFDRSSVNEVSAICGKLLAKIDALINRYIF